MRTRSFGNRRALCSACELRDQGTGVRGQRVCPAFVNNLAVQKIQSYRDLKAWQQAIELVPPVYGLLRKLPREETYALAGQIRRSVVSVAANIAEGHARQHTREFLQHLSIARGSLAELDTLLVVAEKLEYLTADDVQPVTARMKSIRMVLHGITRGLRADP